MRALLLAASMSIACQHLRWQPSQIEGAWASPCLPARAEIGFQQKSVDETETFSSGELQIRQRYYVDEQCKTPYFKRTVVAGYAVRDAVLDPIGARQVDLTERRVLVRPETEQAASDLSQQFHCGREGWSTGVDIDVAGAMCNGVKTPAAGAVIHQIAQVDGDSLYLGSAASGTGAADDSRPSVLSKTEYKRVR
jgi:hypothetical protein